MEVSPRLFLVFLAAVSVVMLSGCALPPLHQAVLDNDTEKAISLINSENYDQETSRGITPLWFAAGNWNVKLVESLIRKGANVNHIGGYWPDFESEFGGTPLIAALRANPMLGYERVPREQYQIVVTLLKNGANPNLVDKNGETPLSYIMRAQTYGVEVANRHGLKYIDELYKGARQLESLLIAYGADISYSTNAKSERRRQEKAESREFWKGAATLATGVAVGKATGGYTPDQQSRMMKSSMKTVDSGDTSELSETTNQVKAEQAQSHKAKMQAIEEQKERDRAAQAKNNRVANANVGSYTPKLAPLSYPSSTKYRCVEKGKGSSMDYSEEKARAVALRYSRPVEGGMNNRKIISSEVVSCKFDAPWTKCVAETKSEVDSTVPCGGRSGPGGGKSK